MNLLASVFGRLNLDALPDNPITLGGAVMMIGIVVVAAILLTYLKKWRWLYREWLTSLDAKKIGVMYIVVALLMLVRGAFDAVMMRAHQALASGGGNGLVDADMFQQVFSAHGTIMIFFAAMGLMFGIINLVLPLMIGARDVAFPFLNSVSFWLFTAGMILVNVSLVIGEFSTAGWLAYPPLSELQYSPGVGVDYWIWSLQITGIGSLLSGINFIVTILKKRAPGMTMMKMPIFAWSVLTSMLLVVFAFPILTGTLGMLSLDRLMGMHFFTSDGGGNPMMYVNLIWAWGHPEVYILILPAFGIFSEVVATLSRKRLFGYGSMVAALIAIMLLSFVVWLHHFFTMGSGADVNAFFGIMTMIIAIPTGVKIFNWLFTMRGGKIDFKSPMLWFMSFVITFTLGGVAGVMMSVPALDFQVHNSLFLVAHFHTMIIGGVIFGFFAGLTYWFPKIFGFKLNDRLGRWAAYSWVIGFTLAFMPLYILGLMGATRRMDSFDAGSGMQPLFVTAAVGVLFIGLGLVLQIAQIIVSIINQKKYRDVSGDPWDGRTLEWSVPSPAPFYNFAKLPQVNDRDAFWQAKRAGNVEALFPGSYQSIRLPKNTGDGLLIGLGAFLAGFGLVWHMWWLALAGTGLCIGMLVVRTNRRDTERVIGADEIELLDRKTRNGGAAA